MTSAKITLDAQVSSVPATNVTIAVLPFSLNSSFSIEKPDDIEISLIFTGDKYSAFVLVVSGTNKTPTFTIKNAFSPIDQDRLEYKFDFSYVYLQKHRSILSLPTTASVFDVTIVLPKQADTDGLSFEPPKNMWQQEIPGKKYRLLAAELKGKEVYLTSPNPFKASFDLAVLVVNLAVSLIGLAIERKYAVDRRLGKPTIKLILALSVGILTAILYFYFNIPNKLQFLSTIGGLIPPLVVAPFACSWLLYVMDREAEVSGSIKIDGQKAEYLTVYVHDVNTKAQEQKATVKKGSYRFFVRCGKSPKSVYIRTSGAGVKAVQSEDYELVAGKPQQIKPIVVEYEQQV